MWEGGSGWGIHVNPWLIHINVWQNPLQFCKVISLQLIKINGKKKKRERDTQVLSLGVGAPLEEGMVILLPGESHGQRSLAGYYPWDQKESDMTEVT